MGYKDQVLTDKEVQEAVGGADFFEDGQHVLEFSRVQVNDWDDTEGKSLPENGGKKPVPEGYLDDRSNPKYLMVNISWRVVEGATGEGKMVRFRHPQSLLLDSGDNIVLEQDQTRWANDDLVRQLMALYGGKDGYPKNEDGSLRGPLSILSDDECVADLHERQVGVMFTTTCSKADRQKPADQRDNYTKPKSWHKV